MGVGRNLHRGCGDGQSAVARHLFCRTRARAAALALLLSGILPGPARAGDATKPEPMPAAFTVISPIFGQLVAFSQPSSFVVAFEDANAKSYIREAVPKGETVEKWSQMITVTGAEGLAANPKITPMSFAGAIADGFEKSCPDTFAAVGLGDIKVGKHAAFAAVVGCGTLSMGGGTHAETALILTIKGASEYYTIQWAERTAASATPPMIDDALWTKRLDELGPVRLCPIVAGETAPYPSCLRE